MKPQEDIGELIKTKIQSSEKTSDEATWERIQHSLEERRRKRRFAFYLKLGSASLLVLIGIFITLNYFSNDNIETTPSENLPQSKIETPKETSITNEESQDIRSDITIDKDQNIIKDIEAHTEETTLKNIDVSEQQPTENVSKASSNNTITEKENKVNNTKEQNHSISNTVEKTAQASSKKEEVKTLKNTISPKVTDSIMNSNDIPVTQTTKKVYYYYNSKNGQEISSMDKRVIDSIMKANEVQRDSLKSNN